MALIGSSREGATIQDPRILDEVSPPLEECFNGLP